MKNAKKPAAKPPKAEPWQLRRRLYLEDCERAEKPETAMNEFAGVGGIEPLEPGKTPGHKSLTRPLLPRHSHYRQVAMARQQNITAESI